MADDSDLKIKEKGKGNKKIIIIAIAIVVLLAAGGGAFFFLSGDEAAPEAVAEESVAAEPKTEQQTAYYVAMPRPFVFNIIGKKRERLVQIKVQLMLRGEENEKLAKANIPLIESTLLQVFSATTEQQLSTFEGKRALRTDALESVTTTLTTYTGSPVVEKILFTGFVMQ